LHRCLDKLREEQRDAIRTAFFEGVTYAELADRKAVPLGTMKTWIRRGLAKLKDCLNGD
jgi:RNA polymerase sigma factor (sigma-70 family)